MSQWGKPLRTEKYEFVPHVDGDAFSPLKEADIVDDVVCTGNYGLFREVSITLGKSRRKYVGKPYSLWLEQFETGETV